MMEKYNFDFNDLIIDHPTISAVMGYQDSILPPPFDDYLKEAMIYSQSLTDIRATYRIFDEVMVDEKCSMITAGGQEFKVGKIVCSELKKSERLAFFVCTAGQNISEKSSKLLAGEDLVLGYVYDVLGSAIAEAVGDKIQSNVKRMFESTGELITNRYSPGYCNWNVADQHKLFSLFGESPVGVKLTDSALMHPVKSISGVFGIGPEVKYRDYQCTLCFSKNCVYKNLRTKKE